VGRAILNAEPAAAQKAGKRRVLGRSMDAGVIRPIPPDSGVQKDQAGDHAVDHEDQAMAAQSLAAVGFELEPAKICRSCEGVLKQMKGKWVCTVRGCGLEGQEP